MVTQSPTPEPEPAARLIVDALSFSYGESPLFDNFHLASRASRIVLKGPSGCGKTTLLKLMFGVLTPSCFSILPNRSDAALILQEDALFPWLTGRQNIELLVSVPSTRIENHPLFPTVADFIERRAYQMSFGQRRAIELFRVLLARPKTIYFDEPFNYLDDYKANTFVEYLSNCDVADLLVVTTHRNDNTLDATSDVLYFRYPPYRELERK